MSGKRFCGLVGIALLLGTLGGALPAAAEPCPGDFNGDDVVNPQDIFDFLEIWFLLPRVDFNADGVVDYQDVIDFGIAYGAGDPSADYNGSGTVTVDDLAAFMTDWSKVNGSRSTDYDVDGQETNDSNDIFAFLAAWQTPC